MTISAIKAPVTGRLTENHFAQQMAAAQWARDHHAGLLAGGWVYDDVLRRYSHPEKRGQEIYIG